MENNHDFNRHCLSDCDFTVLHYRKKNPSKISLSDFITSDTTTYPSDYFNIVFEYIL